MDRTRREKNGSADTLREPLITSSDERTYGIQPKINRRRLWSNLHCSLVRKTSTKLYFHPFYTTAKTVQLCSMLNPLQYPHFGDTASNHSPKIFRSGEEVKGGHGTVHTHRDPFQPRLQYKSLWVGKQGPLGFQINCINVSLYFRSEWYIHKRVKRSPFSLRRPTWRPHLRPERNNRIVIACAVLPTRA